MVRGEGLDALHDAHAEFRVLDALSTDHKLVVAFDNAGEKTLLAKFAKLTKL